MRSFTALSGDSWLQGRHLLPLMKSHGECTTGFVLDLGCGESPLQPFFPRAERYLRMDCYQVDPEVIVITDPLRLPLENASVQVVLLSRMLGDLPDQVAFLRELHRVLEPAGRVLVYEAITYPQHDLPHDYWRVLPEGLRWAARRAGLDMVEMKHLGGYFTQVALHLNVFWIGNLGGYLLTRPLAQTARAACNLVCAGLDRLMPRPTLATDYFACLVKPPADHAAAGAARV